MQTWTHRHQTLIACSLCACKISVFLPHQKINNSHMLKQRQAQINCAVTTQLIRAFVFATWIAPFLCYLYPNFWASSILLSQYRPLCVGPGRNPKLLVFSCNGSNVWLSSYGPVNKVSEVYPMFFSVFQMRLETFSCHMIQIPTYIQRTFLEKETLYHHVSI